MATSTHSGTLSVFNYTNYNTDDILALIDVVERGIPNSGLGRRLTTRIIDATPKGELPSLTLKTFTGTPRWEKVYTAGTPTNKRLLFTAPARWHFPNEFRMLPPDKIYSSAIEALAAAADTQQPVVPADMVLQLRDKICELYDYYGYRYGKPANERPDVSGLSIRIERKKSASAPKRSRKVVALENIQKANMEVSWRLGSAKDRVQGFQRTLARIARGAQVAGISCNFSSDVNACILALEALAQEAERVAIEARRKQEAT
jgi:hypothetical protein